MPLTIQKALVVAGSRLSITCYDRLLRWANWRAGRRSAEARFTSGDKSLAAEVTARWAVPPHACYDCRAARKAGGLT